MDIIIVPQLAQCAMCIIDIARDMQVTLYCNDSRIEQSNGAAGLMRQRDFTGVRGWRANRVREQASDDNAVLCVTFLRYDQYLITWTRGAHHSPTGAAPLR